MQTLQSAQRLTHCDQECTATEAQRLLFHSAQPWVCGTKFVAPKHFFKVRNKEKNLLLFFFYLMWNTVLISGSPFVHLIDLVE